MNQQIDLMSDADCTAFLQWALPRLNLRWPGFRNVHRQVCKRLKRRMSELQLTDFAAYRTRLESRARKGCFEPSSLRELPPHLVRQAFDRADQALCVQQQHREGIDFLFQDLRLEAPDLLFDLTL
jgi:chemotaxis methyl-accepting protein methylase